LRRSSTRSAGAANPNPNPSPNLNPKPKPNLNPNPNPNPYQVPRGLRQRLPRVPAHVERLGQAGRRKGQPLARPGSIEMGLPPEPNQHRVGQRRAHAALLGGVRRSDPRGGGRAPPHGRHRDAGAPSALRAGATVGQAGRASRPEHAHAARWHRRWRRAWSLPSLTLTLTLTLTLNLTLTLTLVPTLTLTLTLTRWAGPRGSSRAVLRP
jgi:hypothetical protein